MLWYLFRYLFGDEESNNHRNCKIFVFGSFLYIVLLVICLNIGLKYEFFAGTLKTGLFLTILVDFCVMGFFYRQKYGRRIFDELSDEQSDWDWDNKHKIYNKKTPEELQIKKISKKINKEIINQKLEQKKSEILSNIEKKDLIISKTNKIIEHKDNIHAAKYIQNWWRIQLYKPPSGIFYLQAKKSFMENAQ